MKFIHQTHTRDDLITYGGKLADIFTMFSVQNVVCLNGDSNAGKSLIPLAADFRLVPERYTHGLHTGLAADTFLKPLYGQNPSVGFHNLDGTTRVSRDEMDALLEEKLLVFPMQKIVFFSNIYRANEPAIYDYAAEGLNSARLDMAIHLVKMVEQPFGRQVVMTVENPNLASELAKNFMLEQTVRPAGVVVPAPSASAIPTP